MRLQLAAQQAELQAKKAKEKDSGFSLQKLAVKFDKRRLASLKSKVQKSNIITGRRFLILKWTQQFKCPTNCWTN